MRTNAAVAIILTAAMAVPGAHAMRGDDPPPSAAKPKPGVPTLSQVEREVKAKQYRSAIAKLQQIVKASPDSVDAYNYLGYSHRQLGEYSTAMGYYRTALRLDPNHRGANEYIGQLYLRLGDLRNARRQLAKLRRICGPGCEEYDNLKASIAAARKKRRR